MDKDQLAQYSHSTLSSYILIGSIGTVLNSEGDVVEERMIVENRDFPVQFSLRVVGLISSDATLLTLHEINVLKSLRADFHPNLMNLYNVFRYRHRVAFLHPPSLCLRDILDELYHERVSPSDQAIAPIIDMELSAHILLGCLKGLDYIHSKGLVHTQMSASSLFIDPCSPAAKIGAFQHSQKIGSRFTRSLTANENYYPPESFCQEGSITVNTSFDIWSVGLLVIELISGKKVKNSREELVLVAKDMIDGSFKPPTLLDLGYDDKCTEADLFIGRCLRVKASDRSPIEHLLLHPFVNDLPSSGEFFEMFWSKNSFGSFIQRAGEQCLYAELLGLQGATGDVKEDLLSRISRSTEFSETSTYLCIDKISTRSLIEEFIAVEAVIVCDWEDADASQYVHDVSSNFSTERLDSPGKILSSSIPLKPSGDRFVSYRRSELIFFIKKSWGEEERQVFISLQFAPWYEEGFLKYQEFLRVVDELDEVLVQSAPPADRIWSQSSPSNVGFNFSLRKGVIIGNCVDRDALRTNFITVDVAFHPDAVSAKEIKGRSYGCTIPTDKTPLRLSITYQFANTHSLDKDEKLSQERMDRLGWQLQPSIAEIEGNRLRYLLEERRVNPNRPLVPHYLPGGASNEARNARLWSNFDRDFLFKFCQLAIPYTIGPEMFHPSTKEPGSDFSLHSELLKTRSKQEDDQVRPTVTY